MLYAFVYSHIHKYARAHTHNLYTVTYIHTRAHTHTHVGEEHFCEMHGVTDDAVATQVSGLGSGFKVLGIGFSAYRYDRIYMYMYVCIYVCMCIYRFISPDFRFQISDFRFQISISTETWSTCR